MQRVNLNYDCHISQRNHVKTIFIAPAASDDKKKPDTTAATSDGNKNNAPKPNTAADLVAESG